MKINIVVGQKGIDIANLINDFNGEIIKFPETKILHSYDLSEYVMNMIQNYYKKDKDINVITYSEVVLDSIRLWIARNNFKNAKCINILSTGEIIEVPISEYGEMEEWITGVFDIKQVILRELFEIRKQKKNS